MDRFPFLRADLIRLPTVSDMSWPSSAKVPPLPKIRKRLTFNISRISSISYMQYSIYDLIINIENYVDSWNEYMSRNLFRRIILFLAKIPFLTFYYTYLFFPILWIQLTISFYLWLLNILSRRSVHVRELIGTAKALYGVIWRTGRKIIRMKVYELLKMIFNFVFDVLKLVYRGSIEDDDTRGEVDDIVYYEETEPNSSWEPVRNRMKKLMHHYVPPNAFRATVRVRPGTGTSSGHTSAYHTGETGYQNADDILMEAYSPMSFPTTPSSRARVMNRSTERVSSVMFAARDRLRLDELSYSRDELSRQAAIYARDLGKFAALDPQQSSEGLILTCGNHCAFKLGDSLCCSCRAMIPIRKGVYTYFEFSITASHEAIPMVSVGIAPQDCPLNVMVGSWATSLGLYTDGQLLVESKWYKSAKHQAALDAGVTVGVLVYVPKNEPSAITRSVSNDNIIAANLPNLPTPPSAIIQFNVNGVPMDYDLPATILKKLQDTPNDIFPTISVLSEGVRVWCRFCEADIVYRSRKTIRAPPGVRVYCLDGSRLIGDKE